MAKNKNNKKNKKNKNYKGGQMKSKNIGFLNNYVNYKTFERPSEVKEYNKINYVIFHQNILNQIQNKCLPVADGCEFQFHYWALQIKINAQDGRRFAFTFPLTFFNFNQKVSGASVDFNLPEVDAEAEKVKEPAKALAKKLIKVFPKQFFIEKGFDVKFEFGDIGSIHRHPGRFGFSSIDLRFDPTKPGVIFRNKEATDLWQVDSVLYCDTNAELITTETRVFNIQQVDPADEDKGSVGTVTEIPTVTVIIGAKQQKPKVDFSDFFGAKKENKEINYLIMKTMDAPEIDEAIELITAIGAVYKPLDFVDEKKIEKRTYFAYGSYGKYGYSWDWDSIWDNHVPSNDTVSDDVIDDYDTVIKTNLMSKIDEKNLQLELLEICEIPDEHKLDENALWDLAKDKEKKLDLYDIYLYYSGGEGELKIEKGAGKLILNEKGIEFYIGSVLMNSENWDF